MNIHMIISSELFPFKILKGTAHQSLSTENNKKEQNKDMKVAPEEGTSTFGTILLFFQNRK